jgi:hypothetical protein
MPGGDRTGPRGMGSMTGRGAGYCSGSGNPGFVRPRSGLGLGQRLGLRRAGFVRGRRAGRGMGTGRGRWRS